MKAWKHFCTITEHKIMVMRHCFRIGLYRQGLLHDMSKYTPTEFIPGCKYYQGYRSPNNAEREEKGYSAAWLHHKGRNKHHYEYWIDYSTGPVKGMTGMKMPNRYVAEMMMDRMAASKIYNKGHYNHHEPLEYYEKGKDSYMIHDETRALLEHLLHILDEQGEEALFAYMRAYIVGKKEYPKIPLRPWQLVGDGHYISDAELKKEKIKKEMGEIRRII